jgi:hypothetical protein
MTAALGDVFADTAYWIALVVKQDQYHPSARAWTPHIAGRITTMSVIDAARVVRVPVSRYTPATEGQAFSGA